MKRLPTLLLLSFVVAVGLLLAAGCDSAGSSMTDSDDGTNDSADEPTATESTTLQMHLTDAPGDVVKANVVIESMSIVPEEDTSNGDSTDVGATVLSEKNFEVDLTELQNGVDTLMSELELESGSYSQIRMITAHPDSFDVTYETAEGDTAAANLFIPSSSNTGIKVNFEKPLTMGTGLDTIDVTLDFSVEDSFIPKGPEGQTSEYNFKPTVKATVDSSSADSDGGDSNST